MSKYPERPKSPSALSACVAEWLKRQGALRVPKGSSALRVNFGKPEFMIHGEKTCYGHILKINLTCRLRLGHTVLLQIRLVEAYGYCKVTK